VIRRRRTAPFVAKAPDAAQVLLRSGGRPRSKVRFPIHRQRPVDAKLLQVPLDLPINKARRVSMHCEGCAGSQQAA
jgi:hypothetical protein